MKKLIPLFILGFVSLGSNAQFQMSNYSKNNQAIIVNSAGFNKNYLIAVNNSFQQTNGNNNIVIHHLNLGNNYIEISQLKSNVFGKQRKEVLYAGNIYLKQNYQTIINIDLMGNVRVAENYINNNYDNNNDYNKRRKHNGYYERRSSKRQSCNSRF